MKTINNVYRRVGDLQTCTILYADGSEETYYTSQDVSEVYARNKGIREEGRWGTYFLIVEGRHAIKITVSGGVSGGADYNATSYTWLHIDTGEHRMIVPKTVTIGIIEEGDDDEARTLFQQALQLARKRAQALQDECDAFNSEYAHAIASYANWERERDEKREAEKKAKEEQEKHKAIRKRLEKINTLIFKFFSRGEWERERNENGDGWRDDELATQGRFAKNLHEVKLDERFSSWDQFCDYAEQRYSK